MERGFAGALSVRQAGHAGEVVRRGDRTVGDRSRDPEDSVIPGNVGRASAAPKPAPYLSGKLRVDGSSTAPLRRRPGSRRSPATRESAAHIRSTGTRPTPGCGAVFRA